MTALDAMLTGLRQRPDPAQSRGGPEVGPSEPGPSFGRVLGDLEETRTGDGAWPDADGTRAKGPVAELPGEDSATAPEAALAAAPALAPTADLQAALRAFIALPAGTPVTPRAGPAPATVPRDDLAALAARAVAPRSTGAAAFTRSEAGAALLDGIALSQPMPVTPEIEPVGGPTPGPAELVERPRIGVVAQETHFAPVRSGAAYAVPDAAPQPGPGTAHADAPEGGARPLAVAATTSDQSAAPTSPISGRPSTIAAELNSAAGTPPAAAWESARGRPASDLRGERAAGSTAGHMPILEPRVAAVVPDRAADPSGSARVTDLAASAGPSLRTAGLEVAPKAALDTPDDATGSTAAAIRAGAARFAPPAPMAPANTADGTAPTASVAQALPTAAASAAPAPADHSGPNLDAAIWPAALDADAPSGRTSSASQTTGPAVHDRATEPAGLPTRPVDTMSPGSSSEAQAGEGAPSAPVEPSTVSAAPSGAHVALIDPKAPTRPAEPRAVSAPSAAPEGAITVSANPSLASAAGAETVSATGGPVEGPRPRDSRLSETERHGADGAPSSRRSAQDPDAEAIDPIQPREVARATAASAQRASREGMTVEPSGPREPASTALPSGTLRQIVEAVASASGPISTPSPTSAPGPTAAPGLALPPGLASASAAMPAVLAQAGGRGSLDGPLRLLTLQLYPADLGTVTVRMRLQDGRLEMDFRTGREETADLLRRDGEALAGLLREAGYQPDAITIQAGGQDPSQGQGSGQGAGQGSGQGSAQGQNGRGQPAFAAMAGGENGGASPDQPARHGREPQDAEPVRTREGAYEPHPVERDRGGLYL